MPTRRAIQPPVDLESLGAKVRSDLDTHGFVKLSAIKPKHSRADLISQLAREGYEVTRTAVRIPLRQQLSRALEHDRTVPLSSLGAHMQGSSAAERNAVVATLVAAGEAHRALRGEAEVLVASAAQVLAGAKLKRVEEALTALAKRVAKAARKPSGGLWKADIEAAVGALASVIAPTAGGAEAQARTDAAVPVSSRSEAQRSNGGQFTDLLKAVSAVRDPTTELSFVPHVVDHLRASVDPVAVQRLLLQAAAKDILELRPEGGIDRLTEAELSVCPAGPHGTRLSWVRALGRGGV